MAFRFILLFCLCVAFTSCRRLNCRIRLEDEANDRSPLADGAALGFVHGELLGSAVGLRLGLEDEAHDGSTLTNGEELRLFDE